MTSTSITCVFALILIVEVFPVSQKKLCVEQPPQCRADNRISSKWLIIIALVCTALNVQSLGIWNCPLSNFTFFVKYIKVLIYAS